MDAVEFARECVWELGGWEGELVDLGFGGGAGGGTDGRGERGREVCVCVWCWELGILSIECRCLLLLSVINLINKCWFSASCRKTM